MTPAEECNDTAPSCPPEAEDTMIDPVWDSEAKQAANEAYDQAREEQDAKQHYAEKMAHAQHFAQGTQQSPYYRGGMIGRAPEPTMKELRAGALHTAHQFAAGHPKTAEELIADAKLYVDFVHGSGDATPAHQAPTWGYQPSTALADDDAAAAAVQKPDAPRVTLAYIMGRMHQVHFTYPPNCPHMIVAEVTFDNGFTILGESAPADPDNFNIQLRQKFALDNAIRKAWPLFGFLLCELKHTGANVWEFMPHPTPDSSTPLTEDASEI